VYVLASHLFFWKLERRRHEVKKISLQTEFYKEGLPPSWESRTHPGHRISDQMRR